MTHYHGGTDWQEGGGEGPEPHLPECPVTTQRTEWGGRFPCFCVELRAAEQRVMGLYSPWEHEYRRGREDAARDVEALRNRWNGQHDVVQLTAAVAAARGVKP